MFLGIGLVGWLVITGGGAVITTYAVDKTGEGINDAGNGALKLALVAGVAYYAAKKGGLL